LERAETMEQEIQDRNERAPNQKRRRNLKKKKKITTIAKARNFLTTQGYRDYQQRNHEA